MGWGNEWFLRDAYWRYEPRKSRLLGQSTMRTVKNMVLEVDSR